MTTQAHDPYLVARLRAEGGIQFPSNARELADLTSAVGEAGRTLVEVNGADGVRTLILAWPGDDDPQGQSDLSPY